jgi:hypothetical protein
MTYDTMTLLYDNLTYDILTLMYDTLTPSLDYNYFFI